MDKINLINYQRIALQKKFGKRNEKKLSKFIIIFLLSIFFSLLFLNTESQVLVISSDTLSPGFLNLGEYLYG